MLQLHPLETLQALVRWRRTDLVLPLRPPQKVGEHHSCVQGACLLLL